jgi:hypothetical protein
VGHDHPRSGRRAVAGRPDHGDVRLDVGCRQGSRRPVLLFGAPVRFRSGRSAVRLGGHARAGAFVGQVQPRAVSVRAAAAASGADPGSWRHGQRRAALDARRPHEFPSVRTRQSAGVDLGVQLLRAQAHRAHANLLGSRQTGGIVDGRRAVAAAGTGLRRRHRLVRHRLRGSVRRGRAPALRRRWHSRCSR